MWTAPQPKSLNPAKPADFSTDANGIPTTPAGIEWLLGRARNGDQETLPVLRKMLASSDGEAAIEKFGGNLGGQVEASVIQALAGQDLAWKQGMIQKVAMLREELAGPTPTPLERLLVERIVACWLRLQDAELRVVQAQDLTIAQADRNDRRIDHAHQRFLTAVKTLATVRRLALPVLLAQINVGNNQTNVGGCG